MAIHEIFDSLFEVAGLKWLNEGYQTIRSLTGIKHWTSYQRAQEANGQRVRDAIGNYIQQRKSGECKSKIEGGSDFLTLLLANQDVFTDDLIIDELIEFFTASFMTMQYTSQTFFTHCAQSPASLKKIREEFIAIASEHPDTAKGNKSKIEIID